MKKSLMSALTGLLGLLLVATGVAPSAQAAETTVYCSVSGTFTISGTTLTSSTSNCAGEITIPANVTEISSFAFNRRNVTKVTFEANSQLQVIDSYAFEFTKISSLTLPPSVSQIFSGAFGSTQLTSISIPAQVFLLFGGSFGASPITSVVFESGSDPRYFSDEVFNGDSQLVSMTYRGRTTLSADPFALSSVVANFLGWSETPGGAKISFPYSSGASPDITLYANWTPKTYPANFNSTGGTPVPTGTVVGGQIQFPEPPTQPGYTFAGWSDSRSGTPITTWLHAYGADLYALWVPGPNAVLYNSNGGSEVANGSFITGDKIAAAPPAPTRTGYSFAGWSETRGGYSISFPYEPGVVGDFTLYAKWTPTRNVVNFDSTGGSNVSAGSFLTDGQISYAPETPSRPGYTFAAWSTSRGGAAISFPFTPSVKTDMTIYAQWSANTNSVNFDSTGGSNVSAGSFLTDGQISDAPETPSRPGYTFAGWAEKSDGAEISFPYSPTATSDITLYAKWTPNRYVVTFNSQRGSNVLAGSFLTDGQVVEAPLAPTRPGYTFAGWSENVSGDLVSFPYSPGVIQDVTLYAKWVARTNAVNFNSEGGTNVLAGSFLTDGQVLAAPLVPIRAGYSFVGWATSESGQPIAFPYAPATTHDITLYAQWFRDPYKPEKQSDATVAGTGIQNKIMTATTGSWDAFPEAAVSLQWYRCDKAVDAGLSALPSGSKCVKINGSTSPDYNVVVADAGKFLTVLVQAQNTIGTTVTTGRSFFAPKLLAPTKIQFPVVTGTAVAKKVLTASAGTWNSNPLAVTTFQWFRCEKATKASKAPVSPKSVCLVIKRATKATYKLSSADEGKFVTSQVTAVNTQGTVAVTASSPHVALTPSNTSIPLISGTPMVGKSLTANTGAWLGFPKPKTAVQWYRCAKPTAAGAKKFTGSSRCVAIKGATKKRYAVTVQDKNKYISVLVSAVNAAATVTITADSQQVAFKPTKAGNPTISGSASVDKTLTASPGRWTAFPEATTSFKWYRCTNPTAAGAEKFTSASGCVAIGGVSGSKYTVTAADQGKYISVLVKAVNSAGSASATSKSTGKVG